MKKIVLLVALSASVYAAMVPIYAQNNVAQKDIVVKGRVTGDEDLLGLPGASIRIAETDKGVITDLDGKYKVQIPGTLKNPVLIFSSVGYDEKKVIVAGKTTVDVVLKSSSSQLSEVIVTSGYSSGRERRATTGSTSRLTAKKIQEQIVIDAVQSLEGKVAGVRVITTTGVPGASPSVYIRGFGSLSTGTPPLYVLDGAPLSESQSILSSQDLENITVIKDASTVLYGSRAANGVVIYRTKLPSRGAKPRVNFYAHTGVQSRAVAEYDFPDAGQYLKLVWEAQRNDALNRLADEEGILENKGNGYIIPNYLKLKEEEGGEERLQALYERAGVVANSKLFEAFNYNPYGTVVLAGDVATDNPVAPFNEDGTLTEQAISNGLKWDTDWDASLINSNPINREVGLSLSAGTKELRYYTSVSYLNQDGTVLRSNFQRIGSRVNFETDPLPWFTFGMRNMLVYTQSEHGAQSGLGYRNPVQWTRIMSNAVPIFVRTPTGEILKDEEGNPVADDGGFSEDREINHTRLYAPFSIYQSIRLNDNTRTAHLLSTIPYFEVTIPAVPGLSFKSQVSILVTNRNLLFYRGPDYGDGRFTNGSVDNESSVFNERTISNIVYYSRQFGVQSVDALLGTELYLYKYRFFSASKTGVIRKHLSTAATPTAANGYEYEERIGRTFGTVSYGLLNRYFVDLSISQDGLSRFEAGNRTSTFYAAGFSWVVSDELFFPRNNILNSLRLKGSYGLVGNSRLPDYFPAQERLSVDAAYVDGNTPGVYRSNLYDPNISWEKATVLNLGLDFQFLKGRLDLEVEYFVKTSQDLVGSRPLVPSSGYSSYSTNTAKVRNSGIELTLNTVNLRKKNFVWNSTLVLGQLVNEILALPLGDYYVGSGYSFRKGKSRYALDIVEWSGVDPASGRPQWKVYPKDPSTGEFLTDQEKIPTYDYDRANIAGNRITVPMLPALFGGLDNTVSFYNFDVSLGIAFELGGKAYLGDYASLLSALSRPGKQVSSAFVSDDVWREPGDDAKIPAITSNPGRAGTEFSTRFLYNNSYARIRDLSIGYVVPKKWLASTKFISTARIYISANNLYTFFLFPGDNPPPKGYDPQIGGPSGNAGNLSSGAFRVVVGGVKVSF